MARLYWALTFLIAISSPWLVHRFKAARLLYDNSPTNLPKFRAFSTHKVLYEDTIRNCEDVVLDEESGMALLSCDPGRDKWNTVMGTIISPWRDGEIYMYLYSQTDVAEGAMMRPLGRHGFPKRNYHPLGIDYHSPSDTVFSVNVGSDGPGIEIFKLTPTRDNLIWQHTFTHPLITTPNNIAAISDHEFYVTIDHYFSARTFRLLSVAEHSLALPLGSVLYANIETGEVKPVLQNIAFPNGVALLNSTHVAVASTARPGVEIHLVNATTKELQLRQYFKTPFFADNLSVDSSGKLLVAGHPYPPELDVIAAQNHLYDLDGKDSSLRPAADRPRASTWVSEWDGNREGRLRDVYVGYDYGTGCTAVRDVKRGVGIISGLYEKGIMVWKE